MKRFFLAVFRWLPFCGEFHKCSPKDFKEAAVELGITTIFSTLPLWALPLLGPFIFKTDVSFTEQVVATISGGELLVYCAALVGPLIYIITRRYGEIRSKSESPSNSKFSNRFGLVIAFPHGTAFILFSAAICLLAGFVFSLMKNPALSNDATKLNVDGIFWTSIVLYLFSLYCFFSASAYRNAMAPFLSNTQAEPDGAPAARSEEDTFAAEWERRNNAG